jgi:pimeloyl-ACP methyl ester carboxylesterase
MEMRVDIGPVSFPRVIVLVLVLAMGAVVAWLYTPDKSRAWLESIYLGQPQDLMQIGDQHLHVRVLGDPARELPVLVLVHGFAASLQSYDLWAEDLAKDYHLVLVDLPGQGLSGPDPGGDYSVEKSVKVIASLLDHLDLRDVTLIGHSMGGQMAWTLTGRGNPRIVRLVLIAPAGFESADQAYGQKIELPGYVGVVEWCLPRFLVAWGLAGAFGDPAKLTDQIIDRFWDLLRAPGNRHATLERLRQYKISDPKDLLRQIVMPVLLLWGTKDQLIPVANAQDYLRDMPQATLKLYDGVGHVPMEESPEPTLRDLRTFLAATAEAVAFKGAK